MKERNYSIDILKFVCAVLVVFLHTEWTFKQMILPFTRCAVPCFFIISGYLLYENEGISEKRLKRNIVHVAKIALWSTVFFAVLKEVLSLCHRGHLDILSFSALTKWVVFNASPFGFHLWYLFAYLYVLVIIYVINRYERWKFLYCIVPLLLLTDLVFGKYSLLLLGWEPPVYFVRNFLFVGLPYFAIGTMIKGNHERIERLFSQFQCQIVILGGGVLLFALTTYLEKYCLIHLDKCAIREHYFSSTFLAISLFLIAWSVKCKNKSWISSLGENDTLYIYIFHPFFLTLLPIIFRKFYYYEVYLYVAPILVLFMTIVSVQYFRKLCVIFHRAPSSNK